MRRVTAAFLSILIFSIAFRSGADLGKSVGPPSVTVEGTRSATDIALLRWALSRFAGAGLDPPTVRIGFHSERDGCDGHPGLFRDRPKPRIDICGISEASTAIKKTMLHELAHAWAHENLTGNDIAEFLDSRGLEVWAGPEAPWELKGSEHAAEIVSWALFDRELDLVTIPDSGPEAVQTAYQLLTGGPLPDR